MIKRWFFITSRILYGTALATLFCVVGFLSIQYATAAPMFSFNTNFESCTVERDKQIGAKFPLDNPVAQEVDPGEFLYECIARGTTGSIQTDDGQIVKKEVRHIKVFLLGQGVLVVDVYSVPENDFERFKTGTKVHRIVSGFVLGDGCRLSGGALRCADGNNNEIRFWGDPLNPFGEGFAIGLDSF